MKSAVIICNGTFPKKEYPRDLIKTADYIFCCDGSLPVFLKHSQDIFGRSRLPDALVGDMDSTSPTLIKKYKDIVVQVSEQESNDMSKAFHYTIGHFKDVDTVHFIAATGKREAHTVANMSLLMEYARELGDKCPHIDIISDFSIMFPITDTCEIDVGTGRAVSIFSPDNSRRIKSSGLQWPTSEVVFDNWWKATLNKAAEDRIRLEFSHHSIALIVLD